MLTLAKLLSKPQIFVLHLLVYAGIYYFVDWKVMTAFIVIDFLNSLELIKFLNISKGE